LFGINGKTGDGAILRQPDRARIIAPLPPPKQYAVSIVCPLAVVPFKEKAPAPGSLA